MNLRQKAKHYKLLYEQLGSYKVNPVVLQYEPLLHYRVLKEMNFPKDCDLEFIHHKMAFNISEELIEFIDKNMNLEYVADSPISPEGYHKVRAILDLWSKGISGGKEDKNV